FFSSRRRHTRSKRDWSSDVCSSDLNQIIKSTMLVLMRESSVAEERKIKLKQLLLHFSKVQAIDLQSIEWRYLQIQRNNQTYQLLLNICYFVVDGLLLTTEKGTFKSPMFSDENINLLFEIGR